ncbi:MAG: IS91 family transposase [Chitinophagaceae bacterium]
MQPAFEVAHVLNAHWPAVQHSSLNTWQLRTLHAVRRCRSAALGSHVDGCTSCGHLRISYNSCRNRHCPKCQGSEREKWIEARQDELLPVPYFHVVFTLPDVLNTLCLFKPEVLYNLLFTTAWSVLNSFGHDPKLLGAQTGMISILHTWGQTMTLHPHLHCIVPGGGLTKQGKWRKAKSEGKYLFSVKAMSKVFRGRFIAALKEELPQQMDRAFINRLYKHQWVVYAKRPFTGPPGVIEYLGRYTHKIAISNHRINNHQADKVTFSYKDYRHGSVKKEMTLDAMEFIRRFSLHILPKSFVRIRHYGICSSSAKQKSALIIKAQLPAPIQLIYAAGTIRSSPVRYNPKQCPCCKKETMETVMRFTQRGPPVDWKQLAVDLLECIAQVCAKEVKN